jgi:hypothetical protein
LLAVASSTVWVGIASIVMRNVPPEQAAVPSTLQRSSKRAASGVVVALAVLVMTVTGMPGASATGAVTGHAGTASGSAAPIGPTLSAVSCPEAHWCMAVGHTVGTSGRSRALVEVWAGQAWQVLRKAGRAPR